MLVRPNVPNVDDFFAFARNPENQAGIGHRAATIEDSELLPGVERPLP